MSRPRYVHLPDGEVFVMLRTSPRILLVGLLTGRRRMPRPSTLARAYRRLPDVS